MRLGAAAPGGGAERRGSRRPPNGIGVNLGDVLIEGDDILGDGVNIAARLEGIAEPNGICISEDAIRQVRGKVEAEFADLGEQSLKSRSSGRHRGGRHGICVTSSLTRRVGFARGRILRQASWNRRVDRHAGFRAKS